MSGRIDGSRGFGHKSLIVKLQIRLAWLSPA